MLLPSQIARMKTDQVAVKVKVSIPRIDLVASQVGPLTAGAETTLERWQAEILGSWGIVEWHADAQSLLLQAYALRDQEAAGRGLQPTADYFQVFPDLMRSLEREGLLPQKVASVRSTFEDVVSSRTNKITRIARMGRDKSEGLSPEEQWLYFSLRATYDVWRHETESLIEHQEAGGE